MTSVDWQAFFELQELVLAEAPEAAVQFYRADLIRRGKARRLTAKQADAAIGGATKALAGVGERGSDSLTRFRWYHGVGLVPIVALTPGMQVPVWPDGPSVVLVYSDTDVVRVESPGTGQGLLLTL